MSKPDTKYKLHYLNLRSRGDGPRFLFHYAGVDFEDCRLTYDQWRSRDPTAYPYNLCKTQQVPVLEVIENGKSWALTQSVTICRFLARRFGLTGKNDFEAAECDEVADAFEELFRIAGPAEYSTDEKFKNESRERLKTKDYPRVLGHLESRLKANGSKHMVGNDWTWADIAAAWYVRVLRDYAAPLAHLLDSDYPTLVALAKSVEALPAIASYIAKRPESKY